MCLQVFSTCAFDTQRAKLLNRAHGVVVSHPLRMRKALGSIPSVSIICCHVFVDVALAFCQFLQRGGFCVYTPEGESNPLLGGIWPMQVRRALAS